MKSKIHYINYSGAGIPSLVIDVSEYSESQRFKIWNLLIEVFDK